MTATLDPDPTTTGEAAAVQRAVAEIAGRWAADRTARQQRTALDAGDLAELADAGLLRTGLPAGRGGLWVDLPSSTRSICAIYRTLAGGDSSVALSSSMHPAVLSFWLATPSVPEPDADAWSAQRDAVFDTVEAGHRWGTITSEPGSGGDVSRSRSTAVRDGDGWLLSGQKHFGSGSGTTDHMLTTAVPEGEDGPDWFYVSVPDRDLDRADGVAITAPWDGQGMRATQSHALTFDRAPAVRVAWPGHLTDIQMACGPFIGTLFTAVVLGIVETAAATAREQLAAKAADLRAYEQVEWAQAEMEAWTVEQVYEGMLRAVEAGGPALGTVLRGKTMAAQLAESSLQRLCRVLGGGTYARRSPFGHWFEDVRALGFLRPPWALAFDGVVVDSLTTP